MAKAEPLLKPTQTKKLDLHPQSHFRDRWGTVLHAPGSTPGGVLTGNKEREGARHLIALHTGNAITGLKIGY